MKNDKKQFHKELAVNLFNHVWELLDKGDKRSEEENYKMVHSAHTSLYHWGQIGDASNINVGEWQISRVYSTLGNYQSALFHGERCLKIAKDGNLAPFYHAYALEAIARAYSLIKDKESCEKYLKMSNDKAEEIDNEEERKMVIDDLENIQIPE
jgi:tetratricopeptide (TPR) repeat protein